ncbi:hypothetical protein LXL04_028656 [Taraxacum kok-saghyz]
MKEFKRPALPWLISLDTTMEKGTEKEGLPDSNGGGGRRSAANPAKKRLPAGALLGSGLCSELMRRVASRLTDLSESEEDLSSDHPEHEGAALDSWLCRTKRKALFVALDKIKEENRKRTYSDCYLRCDHGGIAQGLMSSIQILSFFRYAAPRARSEKTKWAVVMSEFAPIFIYLVISPLVSLIPLGVPFTFASNSSNYPEKLSAYECGFDHFGDVYITCRLFLIRLE